MHGAFAGLFGGAPTQGIPPETVTAFDDALVRAGVDHEVISYPNAGHSFFDRKHDEFGGRVRRRLEARAEFVARLTPPA
jgi:dienelactone hydrolase